MFGNSNITVVKVTQVVEVKSFVGTGTEDDPIRSITEYWSFDGKLLAARELDGVSD